ncbi:MAG: hypothetical protein SFW36_09745 [Leptolyngbyaceae cyanobacterium bins.59]|nr:hypothetical protein [Leptolyngbyaceae cyanobacterium bins.59]
MTYLPAVSVASNQDVTTRSTGKLTPLYRGNRPPVSGEEVSSLASLWARKYVASVTYQKETDALRQQPDLTTATSREGRAETVLRLMQQLSFASARAWSMTETLLSAEMQRHQIDSSLVNPWQIAGDTHALFEKALKAYTERVTPRRLSVVIGSAFGQMRQKYVAVDPRVLGFVSMQFHNTGLVLLEKLSHTEQLLLNPYLKVMDDHMYMPLRQTYTAAAQHELESPALQAVQKLLPLSTRIALAVCEQVSRQNPGYRSSGGLLNSSTVRTSSIRDVEMFQVYLCLCVLEGSIQSVQRELFPLCVMLYPNLNVSWHLVQSMLQTLSWEMHDRLSPDALAIFLPYLQVFQEMFSPEVFGGR